MYRLLRKPQYDGTVSFVVGFPLCSSKIPERRSLPPASTLDSDSPSVVIGVTPARSRTVSLLVKPWGPAARLGPS